MPGIVKMIKTYKIEFLLSQNKQDPSAEKI